MYKRFWALLLSCLLVVLCGCADEPAEPVTLTRDIATFDGEGYTLTYPACFTLVGQTDKMVNFAVEGANMAFAVTIEENPYGAHDIAEYPDLMGIYNSVTILNDHSFAVERYQPNILSAYYLYAMTAQHTYLLEYNFGGTEEQRDIASLFAIDVK